MIIFSTETTGEDILTSIKIEESLDTCAAVKCVAVHPLFIERRDVSVLFCTCYYC